MTGYNPVFSQKFANKFCLSFAWWRRRRGGWHGREGMWSSKGAKCRYTLCGRRGFTWGLAVACRAARTRWGRRRSRRAAWRRRSRWSRCIGRWGESRWRTGRRRRRGGGSATRAGPVTPRPSRRRRRCRGRGGGRQGGGGTERGGGGGRRRRRWLRGWQWWGG